jgi:hypothetical protein
MIDTKDSSLRTDRRLAVATLVLGAVLGANAVVGSFLLDVIRERTSDARLNQVTGVDGRATWLASGAAGREATWASRRIRFTFQESASLKTSSVPLSAAHHTGTETGVPSRLKVVTLTKGSFASAACPPL